jgi:hypothetical protein
MNFEELNLNRFGYKMVPKPVTDSSVEMSSEVYSRKEASSQDASQKDKKDAREVITGTVITACLVRSSDQEDRIEIGQNLDSILSNVDIGDLDFSQAKSLDYLVAFRPGGKLGFILTGIGAAYLGYAMTPTKVLTWYGTNADSKITQSEVAWTVEHTSTGTYTVTHNLNSLNYAVNVTATTSGGLAVYVFGYVSNKGLNSFIINTCDLVGLATDTDFDCVISVFK